MKMKYGLWLKVTVISLALAFLTQSSAYAQDFTQDAGSEEAGTKEAIRQERNPGVPKLATPNPKTAYVPPPLQLSPSQRAMMSPSAVAAYDSHAAALRGATRYNVAPMELSASQQAMLLSAAAKKKAAKKAAAEKEAAKKAAAAEKEAAKKAAAAEKAAAKEAAAHAAKFTKEGVPIFDASQAQYFPQGPAQRSTPISKINVPPPSFAQVSLADDLKNSTAWAHDDHQADGTLLMASLLAGAEIGEKVGREGFTSGMDKYLNIGDEYGTAFRLGFLEGLKASECDPSMYAKLYKELLKRMKEAEDKAKKRQLNPLAPAGAAGGMGGGSGSGGGSGGGGGGGPC